MTMPIPAISAIQSAAPTSLPQPTPPVTGATAGGGFSNSLASAVDQLQGLESTADSLAVSAVTGNLDDIHQATIAATRAQVTLQLAAAVRDKGVAAFNQIMNMQA